MDSDLYTYLSTSEAITDIVGDGIYPHHLPESAPYPVLTIQMIGCDRDDTLIIPNGVVTKVYQIDAWSRLHTDVISIGEAVRQRLQGYIGTMGDTAVLYTQLIDEQQLHEAPTNGSDGWLYRSMQRYKIKHRESIVGSSPNPGSLIQLGIDGKSAYEIAVDNGFEGNEAAWLDSLKGDDGAEGEQGQSAYDIAVAGGFTGDQSAWLASLVGATGSQGIQGETGATGATGSFSGSSSDSLAEGSTNLYYTTARAALKQDAPIRSLCTSDFTWSTTLTDQTWSPLTIPSTGTWYLKMVLLNSTTTSQTLTPRIVIYTAAISGATGTVVGTGGISSVGATITTGSPTVIGIVGGAGTSTGRVFEFVIDVTTAGTIKLQIAHNNGGGGLKTCKGSYLEARKLA